MDWQLSPSRDDFDIGAHSEVVGLASDRREHSRHVTVMRVARLANRSLGVQGLGVIRNISAGGMMIDARIPATVGQQIAVSMLDDQCIVGEVIWQDGASIGLRFADEHQVGDMLSRPAHDTTGRRVRLPRLEVNCIAEIQTANASWEAQLCDLSQRGAKLKTTHRLGAGEQILLVMHEHRPVRGTVRWHAGGYAGVEFHRLLGVDELAQWLSVSDG